MVNNNNLRMFIFKITPDTIVPGANLGFGDELVDLTDIPENFLGSDTIHPIIKGMKAFFRISSTNDLAKHFSVWPVIVQTAGTFTDTVNSEEREVASIVNGCVDDEFGLLPCGGNRMSKLIAMSDDSGLNFTTVIETQFDIPRNIINLLNKEVNTERLQKLKLALVGVGESATQTLYFSGHIAITYISRMKGITIR